MSQNEGINSSSLPPGVDWLPVEKAFAYLKNNLSAHERHEILPLSKASGRVLAHPVRALRANPPLPNSAVDGYGFSSAALASLASDDGAPLRLKRVKGRAAAGAPFEGEVPLGCAIRILTGAALPRGVDTVILQEHSEISDEYIICKTLPKAGANTRARGEDVPAEAVFLKAGHFMRPQDIALCGALGIDRVEVFRPLRVGVLSTGSELVEVGAPAAAHQIFDANRPMLLAMVEKWGHKGVDLGHISDAAGAIRTALDGAAQKSDLIITTGGASTGDEDHIGQLLARENSDNIWRIAIKPGRPLAIGKWQTKPIFGLPGNPVAAFVCALMFVKPALDVLKGQGWSSPQGFELPAAFSKRKKPGRREYLRARLNSENRVEVFASEGSGRISSLSWASGLVELDEKARIIEPGTRVRFIPFTAFGL